jgi:hypothetical protein
MQIRHTSLLGHANDGEVMSRQSVEATVTALVGVAARQKGLKKVPAVKSRKKDNQFSIKWMVLSLVSGQ